MAVLLSVLEAVLEAVLHAVLAALFGAAFLLVAVHLSVLRAVLEAVHLSVLRTVLEAVHETVLLTVLEAVLQAVLEFLGVACGRSPEEDRSRNRQHHDDLVHVFSFLVRRTSLPDTPKNAMPRPNLQNV